DEIMKRAWKCVY
ncbi:hypothetical protein AALP_AAs69848U000100, partial [Arabis alpina]